MIRPVVDVLSRRLVPDKLWALVEPLIQGFDARPQDGGTAPVDDRAVFTAIVFVLTSGCSWKLLPQSFGVTVPTAHRRFSEWTKALLWRRVHHAVLDELGSQGLIDWSRAVLDGASVREKKGISDRSQPGRPQQVRSQDPRAVRPRRRASVGGRVRSQHQPHLSSQPPARRHRGNPHPLRVRTATTWDVDLRLRGRAHGLRHGDHLDAVPAVCGRAGRYLESLSRRPFGALDMVLQWRDRANLTCEDTPGLILPEGVRTDT